MFVWRKRIIQEATMLLWSLLIASALRCFAFGLDLNQALVDANVSTSTEGINLDEKCLGPGKCTEEDDEDSVNESDSSNSTVNRTVDLDRLLEIWNPNSVVRFWNHETVAVANFSVQCEYEMSRYMTGVSSAAPWALKLIDSTGKYSGALISGNKYWLGAVDQCRQMDAKYTHWRKNNGTRRDRTVPPFAVSLTSVRLALTILQPALKGTYNITLSLCLPATCEADDVLKLLSFLEQRTDHSQRRIKILNVRNLSKGYSIWDDTATYIVLSVFIIAVVLATIGTIYDITLRYRMSLSKQKTQVDGNMMTEIRMSNHNNNNEQNMPTDSRNSYEDLGILSEVILSFSLPMNMSQVCNSNVGADGLAPIHGLRFWSLIWVILVHTCIAVVDFGDNSIFRSTAENHFLYQSLSSGTYGVDTFFFMSGCLVSYLYYRSVGRGVLKKDPRIRGCGGKVLQFIGLMWYRYFRLTPPYLLVIGITQIFTRWCYAHSVVELDLFSLDAKNCHKYWWRNALYINTYFNIDERCVPWSWYLANDTQYYTLGVILLLISTSSLVIATLLISLILLGAWTSTAIITQNVHHVPSVKDPFAHYDSLYDKPWARIGPYLIGMMTGWLLCKINSKCNMSKAVLTIGWILSASTMICIVYGVYGNMFDPIMSALYTALSHSGWAMCIGWILTVCVTGNAPMVNRILSWKFLYPLSRLSYCAYLIHPMIQRVLFWYGENTLHLGKNLMGVLFCGFTVVSYIFALILSLLVEAPIVSLLRVAYPLRSHKNRTFTYKIA